MGQDSNGNIRFAIVPSAYQLSPIPAAKAQEIQDYYAGCIKDDKYNITFLGYCGGGQMAYSTAQNLTGRMQVDSLVLLGAPFRAYSGLGNIGRIWDLAWLDDPFKGMEKNLEWDRYNSGYRTVFHLGTSETNSYGEEVYLPEEDIYRNGATKCTFYGPNHQHYGAGDYFDTDASAYSSSGIICTGPGYGFHMSNPDNGSRVDVLVNFLINVVGVGREK